MLPASNPYASSCSTQHCVTTGSSFNNTGKTRTSRPTLPRSYIRVAEITYLVGGSSDQWFPQVRAGTDIVSRLIQERRDTPEIQQRLAKIHLNIGD